MNEEFDVENIEKRMNGALESVKNDFKSLRTGRASSSILDNITVEVYGSKMPISQCATINVPEPRLITINVWDKENISAIEKSIQNSGLGINPVTEGNLLRLPLPELNEERRKEISKLFTILLIHYLPLAYQILVSERLLESMTILSLLKLRIWMLIKTIRRGRIIKY